MIRFKTGDILAEDAEALVNTVNCVGVMGRGIALQFKKAFPENFRAYSKACKRRRGPARPDVRVRDGSTHQSSIHRQFPDQAALARQQPDGRCRGGVEGSR